MDQIQAVQFALQNFYTPVLNLTITDAGGSAQGQQYFEVPYLVRRFRNEYYPSAITPTPTNFTPDNAGDLVYWNQTYPSRENYVFSMSTEQNNYTYVGANTPAPVDILNDSDCLWWIIPFSTKINITVTHVQTLTTAVDTFPVVHKFEWIGYRLTQEIIEKPELLMAIIQTLSL